MIKNILNKPVFLLVIAIYLCIFTQNNIYSNPLLNVNADEDLLYDSLLSSSGSTDLNITLRPFSYYKLAPFIDDYDRVKPGLNSPEDTGYYIKPLNSLTVKFYYSGEDNAFVEGKSGLKLSKGANLFLFEDGYLSFSRHLVFYYQLKQTFSDEKKYDLLRAYAKLFLYKFSLEGGIDSVNLGPGEYGLLLSSNAAPFPMVKIQTEDYLDFLGRWDFLFMLGQLREDRQDYNNPNLLAMRIVWKPFGFAELGVTRTVLFGGEKQGGEKRDGYNFKEYWDLVNGSRENIKGDKFYNDGYLGFDVSISLPINKLIKWIKVTRLYYQEAATQVLTPWQDEREENSFRRLERAFQVGLFVSTDNNIFRVEYVNTPKTFYYHEEYNVEGYSYKDLSLGYPYGGNARSILFKHRYYFTNYLSAEYRLGRYEQPFRSTQDIPEEDYFGPLKDSSDSDSKVKRNFIVLSLDLRLWSFIMEGYMRYDKTENYDENPLPSQYSIVKSNKSFFTIGLSLSWRI